MGDTDQHSEPARGASSFVAGRRALVGALGWKVLHHLLGSLMLGYRWIKAVCSICSLGFRRR